MTACSHTYIGVSKQNKRKIRVVFYKVVSDGCYSMWFLMWIFWGSNSYIFVNTDLQCKWYFVVLDTRMWFWLCYSSNHRSLIQQKVRFISHSEIHGPMFPIRGNSKQVWIVIKSYCATRGTSSFIPHTEQYRRAYLLSSGILYSVLMDNYITSQGTVSFL